MSVFMRSDIEIDYLFFPDVLNSDNKELMDYVKSIQPESGNENIMEVQDEEMFARTSIDMNNPYRPNISTTINRIPSHLMISSQHRKRT